MRSFGTYKGKMKKGLGLILLIIVAACSVLFNVREVRAAGAKVTQGTVEAYNSFVASNPHPEFTEGIHGEKCRELPECKKHD